MSDPRDTAWQAVAAECPLRHDAATHRIGGRVHLIPMPSRDPKQRAPFASLRCIAGVPSREYDDSYVTSPPVPWTRKSAAYDYAEKGGR